MQTRAFTLTAHPDFPSRAIDAIHVTLERHGERLDLRFAVTGAIDDVAWPGGRTDGAIAVERVDERRADELWRHSCFEAFVASAREPGYRELNLATSGHWAAYAFDGYRAGMRLASDVLLAEAGWRFGDRRADIWGAIALPHPDEDWALNVTVVIESRDGGKSYWALAHAPGAPDFHNRECFVATLPA